MPLASTGFMAQPGLGAAATQLDKLDVSDVLAAILMKDTSTLGQIKMGPAINNIEHFWFEDTLNACVMSGCVVSAEPPGTDMGAINFTTSIGANTTARFNRTFLSDTIVRMEDLPTLFITRAPGATSNYVSISVWSSLTGAAGSAYPTTSVWVDSSYSVALYRRWFVVGKPKSDTSVYTDDVSLARTRRVNYTQVFERGIQITETRENIAVYAVPDELKYQIKNRTYEIKRELNNAIINGGAYTTGTAFTGDVEMRTMAGLIQQLRDPDLDGTQEEYMVVNAADAALTITRINDLCYLMYAAGGFDDQSDCVILTSPYQARIIALLEEGRIRRASNELVVGSYANAVKTDLGFDIPVIIDRWMPGGTMIILDKSRVSLHPLSGDAWHLTKMAKTGRSQGYQLSGQYTVVLKNADCCHGMIHRLAYT